ncbi:MAG: hypothetical protein KCHDKBKB_02357 [Elusimicrobia bacterium]|nr:hypothetical protein [Elusimicrobiota bacterium]
MYKRFHLATLFEKSLWVLTTFGLITTIRWALFDYDVWWHLASGRFMLENRSLLRTDVFSHTLLGTPWINFEWLSQILLYLTMQMAGIEGLIGGKVIFVLLVWALLTLVLKKAGARGPWLYLSSLFGFVSLQMRFYERIELISLLLLIGMLGLLLQTREKPNSKLAHRLPWVLSGLMVFWCNLHGGFLYGLATVALLNIGARWAKEKKDFISLLDKSLVGMSVAMLLNPWGPRLLNIFFEHATQMSGSPLFIQEWAPTAIDQSLPFWFLFGMGGLGLTWGILQGQKEAKFWGPVFLLFAIWGTRHMRNTVLLPIFALPFLICLFSSWAKSRGQHKSFKFIQITGWALSIAACWALLSKTPDQNFRKIQTNRFPFGACEFIQKNKISGKLYNTYHMGGAIEWALGPTHPVFMDGRYLFHSLLVYHHQLDTDLLSTADGSAWQKFLASYGIDHAIVDYNPMVIPSQGKTPFPFAWANLVFPRTEWALVYWDDASLVFLKRSPSFNELIKKYEYVALWPYNTEQMKVLLEAKLISSNQILKELMRHEKEVEICHLRQLIKNLFISDLPHVA